MLFATFFTAACAQAAETPKATNPVAVHNDRIIQAPADIVFTNGKVYTVNEKQPWAEAVAVEGNLPEALKDFRSAFETLDQLDKEGKLQLRTTAFMIYKNPEGDVDE